MPFKTRFVSSRYLDPFRRYVVRKLARSRRVSVNGSRNSRKWRGPLFPPIYAHNVMVVVKVEKSADSASVSDQRTGAKRGIGRSTSGSERPWTRDEDGDRERRQKLRLDLNDDISGTGSRIDLEQKAFETADSRASYGLVICDSGFCSRQVRGFKLWNNFDLFSIAISYDFRARTNYNLIRYLSKQFF